MVKNNIKKKCSEGKDVKQVFQRAGGWCKPAAGLSGFHPGAVCEEQHRHSRYNYERVVDIFTAN